MNGLDQRFSFTGIVKTGTIDEPILKVEPDNASIQQLACISPIRGSSDT